MLKLAQTCWEQAGCTYTEVMRGKIVKLSSSQQV